MERYHELVKRLRNEVCHIPVKKISKLDRSDRTLIERRLEDLIDEVMLIQTITDAGCSVVVEMYEHMGGTVPNHKDPSITGVKRWRKNDRPNAQSAENPGV